MQPDTVAAPPSRLIGAEIRRREDPDPVRGRGRYVDDLMLPRTASLTVSRSPHAHARVVRIETSRAAAVPGVIAVGEQMIYDDVETPTPVNPLGAKGCGEAGTIGCTPAVVNTVLDALAPLGATHLDMPLTPARVWAAIQAARTGRSS